MERTRVRALLLVSLSSAFGKYVYVEDAVSWTEAQNYCRLKYTDLAPINSQRDEWKMQKRAGPLFGNTWIGLYRDPTDRNVWRWSGGGKASHFAWASNQPDNRPTEDYGAISADGWHDLIMEPSKDHFFFCYRAIVVRERKTWEGAMQHCRTRHRVLASLASETEMLLVQREMSEAPPTELVWTGLRYLGDRWLWVDREPLKYEAWREGGGPTCPAADLRCGALLGSEAHGAGKPDGVSDGMVEPGVWEARNCSERFHFVCY